MLYADDTILLAESAEDLQVQLNAFGEYCDNPGSNIAVASFNHPNIVKNAEEKIFGDFFEQQPDYTTA
jgi:hypothetical protein